MTPEQYATNLIERFKAGESIASIILELKKETMKGPIDGLIDLKSDNPDSPNIRPWNWLGLYLIESNELRQSVSLWYSMIEIARIVAPIYYAGIAYVGTPYNNLGVAYTRLNDLHLAFNAFLKAFEFDINTTGKSVIALKNIMGIMVPLNFHTRKDSWKWFIKSAKRIIEISISFCLTASGVYMVIKEFTIFFPTQKTQYSNLVVTGFGLILIVLGLYLTKITKVKMGPGGIEVELRPFDAETIK